MLVSRKRFPPEERIIMHLSLRVAQDPDRPELYLSRSEGRRKAGKPARYYVVGHGLGKRISVTADSDEEAVDKANAKLAALAGEK